MCKDDTINLISGVIKIMRIKSGRSYDFLAIWALTYTVLLYNVFHLSVLLYFVALLLSIRLAFVVNNIYDITEDMLHPLGQTKNPLVENHKLRKVAYVMTIFLAGMGILCVLYSLNIIAFLIYTLQLLLSIIYSAPPRLKNIVLLDMISHGFYFGALIPLTIFALWFNSITLTQILILLGIFFFSCAFQLSNQARDFQYDLKAKLNTTAILLGYDQTIKVIRSFTIIGIWLLAVSLYSINSSLILLIIAESIIISTVVISINEKGITSSILSIILSLYLTEILLFITV